VESLKTHDPKAIGPFETIARLGAGGMGVVYLAQRGTERVALKVVASKLSGDGSALTRFLREAQALQLIKNPFVAQIVDSSDDPEHPWIAVEFVSGPSFRELVEHQGPMEPEDWWATALALASALRDTHSRGVTHRDIKPENVLFSDKGPKLIDFGIALGAEDTSVTATGVLAGSPAWLSPEQFDGVDANGASDMFSFGSLLVFLGTGNSPWGDASRATSSSLMKSILSSDPTLEGLDSKQKRVVMSLLAKIPADRHSPESLIEELAALAPTGVAERVKGWETMEAASRKAARGRKVRQPAHPGSSEAVGSSPPNKSSKETPKVPTSVVPQGRSSRKRLVPLLVGVAATALVALVVVSNLNSGEVSESAPIAGPATSCPAFFPKLSEVTNDVATGLDPSATSVELVLEGLSSYSFGLERIRVASAQAVDGLNAFPLGTTNLEVRQETSRSLITVRQHLGEQGCWPGF